MTWAQILGILLGVVLLTVLFVSMGSNSRRNLSIARSTQNQVNQPPPALGNMTPGEMIGTDLAGTNLTSKQCRVTCSGKCGGGRAPIPITKAQKTRNACHENCRATICQGISAEMYNN